MKLRRVLLSLTVMFLFAGVALLGRTTESPGSRMAVAADQFLGTLEKEKRDKAIYPFEDKERFNWLFTPQQDRMKNPTRKGLPLAEMTPDQRQAALALVAAGTSAEGNKQATTIMSLESILRELEKGGAMVRNPEWYFFTIFGSPSKTGKWGWRVEGHHLSLNFVIDGGQVVSATPAFFGANPATVLGGPRKGLRNLPEAEDLAKDLFKSLDDEQKKIARQEKQHPEIAERTRKPEVGEPKGLPAAKMNEEQRDLLWKLLRSYASRMPAEVAEHALNRVKGAGVDKVHFAFWGGLEERTPYTYRLQGPTFVVEFLNVQSDSAGNKANHIHSAWRTILGDFGSAGS